MKKLMLSVFALAAFGFSVSAVETIAGTGTAVLQTTIGVVVGDNSGVLDFGTITITPLSSVITMTAAGVELEDANSTVTSGGAPADFVVSGQTNSFFDVTYENSVSLIGAVHPGATLTLSDFVDNATGTIDALAANNQFQVGGTLTIPALAVVDSYSGSFNVTVVYN